MKNNLKKSLCGMVLCFMIVMNISPVFAGQQQSVTPAQAQTMVSNSGKLSKGIENFTKQMTDLPSLFNVMAYGAGVFMMAMGLVKANRSIMDPSRSPVSDAIKYLGAGVSLSALPSITGILKTSTGINGASSLGLNYSQGLSGASSSTGAQGLDTFMINLVTDIMQPLLTAVSVVGYVCGVFMIFMALQRLTKGAQEGPKGPAGLGTLMNFVIGAALMSLTPTLNMFLGSIFGTDHVTTYPNMSNLANQIGADTAQMGQTTAVITALLGFLTIVGVISFARGLFMLKDTADGSQNASLMGSMSHLIAGVCCVNFGAFANMLQTTLNLQQFGIVFQ